MTESSKRSLSDLQGSHEMVQLDSPREKNFTSNSSRQSEPIGFKQKRQEIIAKMKKNQQESKENFEISQRELAAIKYHCQLERITKMKKIEIDNDCLRRLNDLNEIQNMQNETRNMKNEQKIKELKIKIEKQCAKLTFAVEKEKQNTLRVQKELEKSLKETTLAAEKERENNHRVKEELEKSLKQKESLIKYYQNKILSLEQNLAQQKHFNKKYLEAITIARSHLNRGLYE